MSTQGRRVIRKVPAAARDLFEEIAHEYTMGEWADALGIYRTAVCQMAQRAGVKTRQIGHRAHLTPEQRAEHQAHVAEIAARIDARMLEAPEARPPRHASASPVSQAAHRQASVIAEVPSVSRTALLFARTPAGGRLPR
jgi:hypothetical protein